MRLLPQELGRAQEEPSAQLPADDVVPEVHEQRQIAIRLDRVLHDLGDDGLAGGPDGQRLSELVAAGMGHPRDLRIEALDVIGLRVEQRPRHEQREVDVVVPGPLDVAVELVAHRFPDGEAVGTDDHAATDRRVIGQLCLEDDIVVPAGEILRLTGEVVT